MYTSRKSSNVTKHILIHFLITVSILMAGSRQAFASELEKAPNGVGSRFLVLNDCDDDNDIRTAPYGDTVYIMDSRGEIIRVIARGLTVNDQCGGLSVSEDGRFFIVCHDGLAFHEVATGRKLWFLSGIFGSVTFADGLVYASNADSVYVIDRTGTIVKHARIGVFDFTIDPFHDALWISGFQIRKYNLDLKPILTVHRIQTVKGPYWIELNPDGSLWLARRDTFREYGSEDGLVKVSPKGRIIQTVNLNFCPQCVLVDQANGSIWVTGKGYRDLSKIGEEFPETLDELNELTEMESCTRKYDSNGGLLFHIHEGGDSIVVDPFDGSIWITGKKNIAHFSSTGEKLELNARIPDGQKWLALIPGRS